MSAWLAAGTFALVVAVEPELRAAALGRRAFPYLPTVAASAVTLPFAPGSAVGATVIGVLSVVAAIDDVVGELARVVAPGGVIAISDLVSTSDTDVVIPSSGTTLRPAHEITATLSGCGGRVRDRCPGAVVAAAAGVLDVDSVGAMLRDAGGELRLLGASDDLARLMEVAQLDTGHGPGIETTRTGHDVAIADLGTVTEPTQWAQRLRAAGAGAVLSSPIIVAGVVVGNLDSIVRRTHIWTPDEIRAQRAYARVIAAMLPLVAPPTETTAHQSGR